MTIRRADGGDRVPLVRSSLTRLWGARTPDHEVEPLERGRWASGDYVLCEVVGDPHGRSLEIPNGRLVALFEGDLFIGALGSRFATLEATGSWAAVGPDGRMHLLGTGGICGLCQSRSSLIPAMPDLRYRGHLKAGGEKLTMKAATVRTEDGGRFRTPTILLIGTSMSAGKTTAARVVVRRLKRMGLSVLGAKLAGAGRYRDILAMADAGADFIFDFVDAGLPSTHCPEAEYRAALGPLLGRMAGAAAEIAVIEIGSSPLEPYNGLAAIETIRDQIVMNVLCASDPYAVAGALAAYDLVPDLVTGPTSNTEAGIQLVERMTDLEALDFRLSGNAERLDDVLAERLARAGLPPRARIGETPPGEHEDPSAGS